MDARQIFDRAVLPLRSSRSRAANRLIRSLSGAREGTRQQEFFDPPRAAMPVQICGTGEVEPKNPGITSLSNQDFSVMACHDM